MSAPSSPAWTDALVGIVGFVVSLLRGRAKRRAARRMPFRLEPLSRSEYVLRNVSARRHTARVEVPDGLRGLIRVPERVDLSAGEGCLVVLLRPWQGPSPTDLTVWVDGRAEPVHVPVPSKRAG